MPPQLQSWGYKNNKQYFFFFVGELVFFVCFFSYGVMLILSHKLLQVNIVWASIQTKYSWQHRQIVFNFDLFSLYFYMTSCCMSKCQTSFLSSVNKTYTTKKVDVNQGQIQEFLIEGSNLLWGVDLINLANFSQNPPWKWNNLDSRWGLSELPKPPLDQPLLSTIWVLCV